LLLGADSATAALSGPDVSSWQHPGGAGIDWGQVRGSGQTFAFVKATEGPTGFYQNPYFTSDWGAIRGANLIRGAYHFARPEFSASDQANYFASVIGSLNEPGDLPPVLDLESTGGLAPGDLIAWTQAFLSRLQAVTGRVPMVYSYPYFIRTSLGNTSAFNSYPLWLADYTGTGSPSYPLPGGWGSFTFWQFTSQAAVPGISGNVDMSNYCCDQRALNVLALLANCRNNDRPGTIVVGHPSQQVAADGGDCALWDHPGGSAGWAGLGGLLLGAPAVVPSGSGGSPYYIVTGSDGDLWIRDGTSGWGRLDVGGQVACRDNPAAVVISGTLWVACQGADNALWMGHGPASGSSIPQIDRSNWQGLGGQLISGPAVASTGGSPTFFALGADHHVWLRGLAPGFSQTSWICNGHPAAATYATNTYFACQGADRALWYATNPGAGWTGAGSLGGILIDGPGIAASPFGPTFYGEGQDTAVWERTLGSGWSSDSGIVQYGVGAAWIP
jgi:lysozyme